MQKESVLCCQRKSPNLYWNLWLLSLPFEVDSLNLVWFTSWPFPFVCCEVQVKGEFDLHVLKTEIKISHTPSLWRAGGSQAKQTHFSIWCHFFRILLPEQVPLAPGTWGQQFPHLPACSSWLWSKRVRSSLSLTPETSASPLIISCLNKEWLLVCQPHSQKHLLWAFPLAGLIQWEYFFAWGIWDRDICVIMWYIHCTLPRSMRLYQHAAKTVYTSPLKGAEPRGPNLPQTPEKTDPWRSLCSDRVSLSPESPEKHTRFSDTTKTIFSCDMLYHKLSPCPMPLKLSSVFLPLPFHSVSQLSPAWLFSCLNRSIGLHRSLLHVFP